MKKIENSPMIAMIFNDKNDVIRNTVKTSKLILRLKGLFNSIHGLFMSLVKVIKFKARQGNLKIFSCPADTLCKVAFHCVFHSSSLQHLTNILNPSSIYQKMKNQSHHILFSTRACLLQHFTSSLSKAFSIDLEGSLRGTAA